MNDFIYCYGIGEGHMPCLVRQHCQRHTRIRELHFHVPADRRWHLCRGEGDHFIKVEKADEPAV